MRSSIVKLKSPKTMYILPYRRRNCLIIYFAIFLLLVTFVTRKVYVFTRTWTNEDWAQLEPDGGLAHYQHDYVIPGAPESCPASTKLVIIIFSRPEAASTRSVLRETWLSPQFIGPGSEAIVHRFIFGNISSREVYEEVAKESSRFGDIIIDRSFNDSYRSLVFKTISMVNWINLYCPEAEALLKTDDDSWINVSNLLEILPTLETGIHGYVYQYPGSASDPDNIWYMPPEVYPFGHYPDFASGSGYLIVNHGAQIYRNLLRTLFTIRTIWTEDVFLTGLTAEKAHIKRYHHSGFNPNKVAIGAVCRYKTLISSHKLTESELSLIHQSMTDAKLNCDST